MAEISKHFAMVGFVFILIAFLAMLFAGGSASDSNDEENKNARPAAIVAVVSLVIGVLFFAAHNFR